MRMNGILGLNWGKRRVGREGTDVDGGGGEVFEELLEELVAEELVPPLR